MVTDRKIFESGRSRQIAAGAELTPQPHVLDDIAYELEVQLNNLVAVVHIISVYVGHMFVCRGSLAWSRG